MQITHEQAREWIHLDSDAGLNTHQKQILNSHMHSCAECQRYAESVRSMERVLRPLLERQWNQQPVPLSMGALLPKSSIRTTDRLLLATRIAAIGVMFIMFMFSAWQFSSGSGGPNASLADVPSMPIPVTLIQSTSTRTGPEHCGTVSYIVRKDDTLAGIASQFSVSMDELIQINALTSNTMITGQELIIPICGSTPTSTVDPLTTTSTPVLGRTTSTPGG